MLGLHAADVLPAHAGGTMARCDGPVKGGCQGVVAARSGIADE